MADPYDAIQDYKAERQPYLNHTITSREAFASLFPDAVSCPVASRGSGTSPPESNVPDPPKPHLPE